MFLPVFPIYIRALAPLYNYANLVWFIGVCFLWFTRHTHQLAGRWGNVFYIISSFVRLIGVLLIAIGWLALYTPSVSRICYRKDKPTSKRQFCRYFVLACHDNVLCTRNLGC
jgi:hypothetical protein